jgi:FAD/FMN-containing dehydrogenase
MADSSTWGFRALPSAPSAASTQREVVRSWGNVLRAEHMVLPIRDRLAPFPRLAPGRTALPFGNGRSYGDSCLNAGEVLLQTRFLDRFIHFDTERGTLACEAGVLLADILRLVVPRGWLLQVTPGTRFVTVGGAIANDVHGKNHHCAGTFGNHVSRLELLRSDGRRLICSREMNQEWFAATVGGLGLTGLITWAEIDLRRIPGPLVELETIPFRNLDEFLVLCGSSDLEYEYTVAWIDCLSRGRNMGRGLLLRANHSSLSLGTRHGRFSRLSVPFTLPFSLAHATPLRLFNDAYYFLQSRKSRRRVVHLTPFFYPLDRIAHWNRVYGPRGFYQYQCAVPIASGHTPIAAIIERIARSGFGSLAVLKQFGHKRSPGILSFPCAGLTLSVDFANRGGLLERLFGELDAEVLYAGGRLYPAKDGRMPGTLFRAGYPAWQRFRQFIDPCCSSSFWRRVMQQN